MSEPQPPVNVVALFFDDIRLEFGNKITMVGQYSEALFLADGMPPVDRLSILLYAKWPREYHPKHCALRIEIPGQPSAPQEIPVPKSVFPDHSGSQFSASVFQTVIHLRFPPLRVNDKIDVWFQADGHDFPAGRLHIVNQPIPGVIGQPGPPAR